MVDSSIAGSSNITLASTAPTQPPIDLGDDVEPGVAGGDRAEEPVDERDDRVEVGARHGAEHEDQPDQRAGGGGGVLEQLQADVGRATGGWP